MWILTEEFNLYEQQGAYFRAAWLSKPTIEQVMIAARCRVVYAEHILAGGGQRGVEDGWFHLFEYEEAE